MSAGQDFSSTFLQAQQQQTQRALAIADQIWQQKKLDLDAAHQQMMQQAQEWAQSEQNPLNQYHSALKSDIADRSKDREADNARLQQQDALKQMEALQKVGATNQQALGVPGLPPGFADMFTQGGVAQMNAGGPKVPAQPGQTFPDDPRMSPGPNMAPQGQVGPQGPPPGAMMAGGVAGAGMQQMPPQVAQPAGPPPRPFPQLGLEGTPAVPFGQDDFMQQQSPGFMQAQQKAQSGMANQQSLIEHRGVNEQMAAGRLKVQEARQKLAEKIGAVRIPEIQKRSEKLALEIENLPDAFEQKQAYMEALTNHIGVMEDARQSELGLSGERLALSKKQFAATQSQRAMSSMLSMRKAAYQADLDVSSDQQKLAKLKGQRDKLMKDPNIENDPSLQMQAADIQNQAQAVEQQLMVHRQNKQVADQLRQQTESDLTGAGILAGPATKAAEKPVQARRIAPPKPDLNALKLKYGVH